ncbi:MAG TPA: TIGR02302 family protein, partial [Candidatus Sulfotelmatobacter sp.]|nr:TIGR02302 family protein [Candidatus Sulfotelmatobacter sp.]
MSRAAAPSASSAVPPRRYRLAYAALLWEAAWPALWPALAVIGLFLAVALFDVLPELNPWLHGLVLVGFAMALVAALVRGFGGARWPSLAGARRRLETTNRLAHRPLTALEDRPAGGDPATRALWQAHVARMAAQVRDLKVGVPTAGWGARDPFALRAGLALTLLVAALFAGVDGADRLGRALMPGIGSAGGVPTTLDVWITPPDYTGVPPIFAASVPHDQTLRVPAGSTVLAQAGGLSAAPSLTVGGRTTAFQQVERGSFRAEATLVGGDRLSIMRGNRELAGWPIQVVPDEPPSIAFHQPPARTARSALRIDYAAQDDYGLESARAVIRRVDKPELPPIELPLVLPGKRREAQGTSYHDLTAHPWAGLPVTIQLEATDALGQIGASDPVTMTLPERTFSHPVARAIVEQRKILVRNPGKRPEVEQALARIAALPHLYGDDTAVFLSLMAARARLAFEDGDSAIDPVQQLLWDTAISIEEGEVGLRERDLRAAEDALRDALARNAPDPELQRLIDQMQQALDRYLDSMMQQLLNNPQRAERIPRDRNTQMVDRRDLQNMLDRARELARQGQREQAQALLNQLQQMLENMRAGIMDDANDMDADSEMGQAMQGLQDLARR